MTLRREEINVHVAAGAELLHFKASDPSSELKSSPGAKLQLQSEVLDDKLKLISAFTSDADE